jgi:transcriptional regulator NrdR family protein
MDCKECGASSLVRETRHSGVGTDMIRRRRVCDNGHRFTSYEFAVPDRGKNYSPKAVYEHMQKLVLATSVVKVKR